MKDEFIICLHCGSNACYHLEDKAEGSTKPANIYSCFGCGFSTNDEIFNVNVAPQIVEELEKSMPELFKDIKWKDENGNFWYPQTLKIDKYGMVFVDGTNKDDWKWAAVKAVPIPKKEKKLFPPKMTHKMDMTNKKLFEQSDFMEALDHIGYFEIAN